MKIEFYHRFHLPELGIDVQGQWDHYEAERVFRKLIHVEGKSVLDVACRDGWYSVLFENMGASSVVAMDIDDREARRYVWGKVGSKATFLHRNIYTLAVNPSPIQAQVVFTGDLLLHLNHPLLALFAMHNACTEHCYLACDVSPETQVGPAHNPNIWTEQDLMRFVKLAQFKKFGMVAKFYLRSEYWRSKPGYLWNRTLALIKCEKNPDFKVPELDELIYGSPVNVPELVAEVP